MTRPNNKGFWCYVGNLPTGTDSQKLEGIFRNCNAVKAKVSVDQRTGKPYRYGYVEFASNEDMQDAILLMNGTDVGGKKISVHMDEEQMAAEAVKPVASKTRKTTVASEVAAASRGKRQLDRSVSSAGGLPWSFLGSKSELPSTSVANSSGTYSKTGAKSFSFTSQNSKEKQKQQGLTWKTSWTSRSSGTSGTE